MASRWLWDGEPILACRLWYSRLPMTLTVRRRYGVSAYQGLMQLFGAQYLTRYNMV